MAFVCCFEPSLRFKFEGGASWSQFSFLSIIQVCSLYILSFVHSLSSDYYRDALFLCNQNFEPQLDLRNVETQALDSASGSSRHRYNFLSVLFRVGEAFFRNCIWNPTPALVNDSDNNLVVLGDGRRLCIYDGRQASFWPKIGGCPIYQEEFLDNRWCSGSWKLLCRMILPLFIYCQDTVVTLSEWGSDGPCGSFIGSCQLV